MSPRDDRSDPGTARSTLRIAALAAVLLIALALVAWLVLRQPAGDGTAGQGPPREAAEPTAGDGLVRLTPLSPSAGGAVSPRPCTPLPAGVSNWQLLLPVQDPPPALGYALEILSDTRRLLSGHEVGPPTEEGFVFDLPAGDLSAGRYRLHLAALGEGEPALIGLYCIELPAD